jgi:hypothetical protein
MRNRIATVVARLFVLTLVVLSGAAAASAQPAPWQPERLSAGWTFTPAIALGTLHDNNVTLQNEGNVLLTEWVGLVNPRGELTFNGRRTRFNAGYSGALEAYRRYSELNRYEQRSRVSLRHQPTERLSLTSQASYNVMPTTDRLELGTLPFLDVGSRMTDAGGGFQLQMSTRTTLAGEYRFQHVRFDRDIESPDFAFLNGGHAHSPGVRLLHQITQRLSVGGEWQYRRAELLGVDERFNVQNFLGSASLQLGPATSINGGVGTSHLTSSGTNVSVWGPAVQAGLSHQVERATVTARYFRSFAPSFSFGGLTGNHQFTASVRAPLTSDSRLTIDGGTSFTRTEPVAELGQAFQVDSLTVQGGLGYQVSSWLRADGFVASSHQNSTARGNVDRLRIGIQFVTSKPVRIE